MSESGSIFVMYQLTQGNSAINKQTRLHWINLQNISWSLNKVNFLLQLLQAVVSKTKQKHLKMEVSFADHRCSQVDKQEWSPPSGRSYVLYV